MITLSENKKMNFNSENSGKKKSAIIANRMEEHWSGNGGNASEMHMINIQLKSKGNENKSLIIKLKASKISDEILNDLPALVRKFF